VKNQLLIHHGKFLSKVIQAANLGNGSTWPGHIALKANPHFIKDLLKKSQTKVIFVVGTNGKTTTTALLSHLLKSSGHTIIQNISGANLINGIASTLLLNSDLRGRIHADYALFEVDENVLPLACKEVTPDVIIMLNLFRDQLDRYGEINTIARRWKKAIATLPSSTRLILNADDPQIAFLGKDVLQNVSYFGLDEKGSQSLDHASDSTYCPICNSKLVYKKSYYSHLGQWSCPKNDFEHPKDVFSNVTNYPINGLYNRYNIHAAVLAALSLSLNRDMVEKNLASFQPAFGRQEKIIVEGKNVEVILAKNPAGFNQTLQTISELNAENLLLILNDRIADGTDISWIWDVDFEKIDTKINITLSGDRVYDLGLRVKYAGLRGEVFPDLKDAIKNSLSTTPPNQTLFILPTYTAMLDVRKLLVGKKIL
jgi:UDP-N-acetylmuramyl tripeptide synthase